MKMIGTSAGKSTRQMKQVKQYRDRASKPAVKAFGSLIKTDQCPRNVNDVYTLGVKLQTYIVDRYMELAALDHWTEKALCADLAAQQLEGQRQIQLMADYNLNLMLTYFYNNGGPVIEDPVSETEAGLILPFYTRIMVNFERHVHNLLMSALKSKTFSRDLQPAVNGMLVSTYSAISDLYQSADMQNAFMEMANVIRPPQGQ